MNARGRLIGYEVDDVVGLIAPADVRPVYEECPPGQPIDPVDDAILQAIEACEDSEIVTVSGLAALAVQTAAPILLAGYHHQVPNDGHCVCYHLTKPRLAAAETELDELRALFDLQLTRTEEATALWRAEAPAQPCICRPTHRGDDPICQYRPAPPGTDLDTGPGKLVPGEGDATEQPRLTVRPEHLAAVRAIDEVGG